MIVLGLFFVLAAAAFVVDAVLQNRGPTGAALFGQHLAHVSMGMAVLSGVIAAAIALLGLALVVATARRAARRRRMLRQAEIHDGPRPSRTGRRKEARGAGTGTAASAAPSDAPGPAVSPAPTPAAAAVPATQLVADRGMMA